ncbi:MAG: transglutaminase family protein, partial [Rhodospirillaceae bacterium]
MVDAVAVRQELAMLGRVPDDRIPLVEAALLFAALDRPVPSLEPYRAEIAAMERIVRAQTEDLPEVGLSACMDALRAAIIDHGNFSGDVETYDDPDNANLIRVIERRKGLPIALGLMCIHLGDSMGGIVQGLTFPG